ncbi:MAG TPA: glutaredoxin family protein [Burkholderiales bacterium]|nr:glutaredoxin family protein [Burkholderiales bacterium]
MRAYLIAAACLWIAAGNAAGQLYRWVDDQGGVHYTQTPPPPRAKDVQRKNFRSGGTAGSVDLPYATQLAAKNYPVTLYTQPDCGAPCDDARGVLVKRSVPFREVSVLGQAEVDEVKRISGGLKLPLLVVGSQSQVGFQEGSINGLLDTAGYPRSGQRIPVETLRKAEPASSPPSAQTPPEAPRGTANGGYR